MLTDTWRSYVKNDLLKYYKVDKEYHWLGKQLNINKKNLSDWFKY